MKQKILLIVFLACIGVTGYSQGDTWKKIASLPGATARIYGIAFGVQGKGYFGTGIDSTTQTDNNNMWMYDSVANYWTQVSFIPVKYNNALYYYGRSGASAFTVNGDAYVIGGYCSTLGAYLKDVWKYDATANTWTAKKEFPGVGRAYAVAAGSDMFGKGFYGTGFRNTPGTGWGTFIDFWEYTAATDTWASKPAIPVGRGKAAAFVITPAGAAGNCVYVVGGNTEYGKTGYLNDCYKYDPVISTWSIAAPLPGVPRENPVAFAINNIAYVGLGNNLTAYLKDLYAFDANTSLSGVWSSQTALAAGGRYGGSVFTIGNSAYVVAGLTAGGYVSETWAYSTDTKKWTERKNADIGVRNGAAGFALNGVGYIAGGYDGGISGSGDPNYDMFKYDPVANLWSKSNDFLGGVLTYAPSFVLNNIAYVYTPSNNGDGRFMLWAYNSTTGVWTQKSTQTFSVDQFFTINNLAYGINTEHDWTFQYNPANNAWTPKASFPGLLGVGNNYRLHGVAFSINGKGYYGLGSAGFNTFFADMWEYNPATDAWVAKADFPAGGRNYAVSFTIGDYGYVGTGSSTTALGTKDFYRFEPKSNKWVRIADFIGGPRQLTAAFVINNKAYVGTGDDDYMDANDPYGTHKDFYEYTPAKITLPVSLLNFTAVKQGQNVLLTWQTAQEVNTASFTLQRSADGNSFENIGTVKAAGNSNSTLNYNYTDMLIKWPANKAYYRVQETDKDGKTTLSNIVAVAISLNNKLTIYPNPVKDIVYVQGDKLQSVIILDNTGRQVIKQNAAGNTIYGINVSNLAAGTYTVQTIDAKGNIQTTQMLKK